MINSQVREAEIEFPEVWEYWTGVDPITGKFNFDKYRFHLLTGGRGSSKSYTIGAFLLALGSMRYEKVLCTREIQNSLDESVHELLSSHVERYNLPYVIKKEYIYCPNTGTNFIFEGLYRNVQKIKSTEGITISWCEEANYISKESLKLLIPTVRLPGSKLIFSFNPKNVLDSVWDEFMITKRPSDGPGAAYYLHTTYFDNPYASEEFITEAERVRDKDHARYCHEYKGEIEEQGEKVLIGIPDYLRACERVVSDEGAIEYGVDCARYGQDSSSITKRKGLKHIFTKEYNQRSTTELARIVMAEVNHDKTVPIKIDIGGLGAGTYDTLFDEGYNVIEINFGSVSQNPDRYADMASEMWKSFEEIIDQVHIEDDERLKTELTTRMYSIDKKSRYKIESKDEYKKRGYRSPDKADSFLLAFLNITDKVYYRFV